ncbi:calpain 2, (m II) large subunit [Cichlidogyrus casuarinus]|uniref:Calpain 2, (M II) large subunit n=1 Tax=Cichlidogyrus casuarinus TaxID=1844966 RepID=A0ABD2QKC7_9PLAT
MKLKSLFDESVIPYSKLNSSRLLKILNNSLKQDSFFAGFSLDTVRSLVSMKDFNREDSLNFADFHEIWELLRFWKVSSSVLDHDLLQKTFNQHDELKQGKLDAITLRRALLTTGIQIEDAVHNVIMARFSNDQGLVEFNDFVHLVARLNFSFAQLNAYTRLMRHSAINRGQVTIRLPRINLFTQFISNIMYS